MVVSRAAEGTLVIVPREGVNDDLVRLVEWLVEDGARVSAGQSLAVLETTKSTFDLESPAEGFAFRLAGPGAEVPVGAAVAVIAPRPERPALDPGRPPTREENGEQVVTNRAKELIQRHSLSLTSFAGLPVVRAADVEAFLGRQAAVEPPVRSFRGEPLDITADWDGLCDTALRRELSDLLTLLRQRMRAKFNRHVSTGNLLHDRWELAKDAGFGEGSSVYDDCLILGDVKVGRHCWIGPGVILDGLNGRLTIGDYVDVGAGAHLYTHNTIERALTGHRAPLFRKDTAVGNCCFIAPHAILAPGTVLGDHCFVAAGSYVEGVFPASSFIAGNPAKRVGVVEVRGDRVRVRHFPEGHP
jgi:acetyltransferase-like isoleucine patch superfamily enzyme